MAFILAGFLAALMSWVLNQILIGAFREKAIIYWIPLVEETNKTLWALAMDSSILLVHGVFGTIEAIYDIFLGEKKSLGAGFASYFGHLLYGLLAQGAYGLWSNPVLAVLAGFIVHFLWNNYVLAKTPNK